MSESNENDSLWNRTQNEHGQHERPTGPQPVAAPPAGFDPYQAATPRGGPPPGFRMSGPNKLVAAPFPPFVPDQPMTLELKTSSPEPPRSPFPSFPSMADLSTDFVTHVDRETLLEAIRGSITVLVPGDALVIRVPGWLSPEIQRGYRDSVNKLLQANNLDNHVLILAGEEFMKFTRVKGGGSGDSDGPDVREDTGERLRYVDSERGVAGTADSSEPGAGGVPRPAPADGPADLLPAGGDDRVREDRASLRPPVRAPQPSPSGESHIVRGDS